MVQLDDPLAKKGYHNVPCRLIDVLYWNIMEHLSFVHDEQWNESCTSFVLSFQHWEPSHMAMNTCHCPPKLTVCGNPTSQFVRLSGSFLSRVFVGDKFVLSMRRSNRRRNTSSPTTTLEATMGLWAQPVQLVN